MACWQGSWRGRFSTDTSQLLLEKVFGSRPRAIIIQSSLAGCVVSAHSGQEGSQPAPRRARSPLLVLLTAERHQPSWSRGHAPDGGYAPSPLITHQLAMSLGVARQVTQLLPR
jgi:hypothetical protein